MKEQPSNIKIAPAGTAMSTLCWIAFYAIVKNTPAWGPFLESPGKAR